MNDVLHSSHLGQLVLLLEHRIVSWHPVQLYLYCLILVALQLSPLVEEHLPVIVDTRPILRYLNLSVVVDVLDHSTHSQGYHTVLKSLLEHEQLLILLDLHQLGLVDSEELIDLVVAEEFVHV